ncbi:wall-associated receptor kinase-like 3 [Rutidosis leptorrhynchoides]|uniref:wall-associated receptor kinase-like 3 n=1 Tax=Rutidosis leptorrhynchoides TaxID=125765 RepID=UPI003A98FC22
MLQENLFEHLYIPRSDIMSATNNFSMEYCLGHVGYTYFYRAELEHFDQEKFSSIEVKNKSELLKKRSTVFIKHLCEVDEEERKLLFNEIEMITTCKHPNIVALLGLCIEDFEMILVFENHHELFYKYLSSKDKFIPTWSKRLRICLDVANGLKYLHYEKEDQKMILHRNICSFAIVLDEKFKATVSNFRHSVFLQPNVNDQYDWPLFEINTYYLDPDYFKTGVTTKDWHMWPENASTMEH